MLAGVEVEYLLGQIVTGLAAPPGNAKGDGSIAALTGRCSRGSSGGAFDCGAAGSGAAAGCQRTGHQDGHSSTHDALVFHLDFPPSMLGLRFVGPLCCLYDTASFAKRKWTHPT